MANQAEFGRRVKSYLRGGFKPDGSKYAQVDLAAEIGSDTADLSRKLNDQVPLGEYEMKALVKALARFGCIITRQQAIELLDLMSYSHFSSADWHASPLSKLEDKPLPSQPTTKIQPSRTASKISPANLPDPEELFPLCVPLPARSEFFGRERERMQLIGRVRRGGSVSIVGERRIGKTWLLSYLKLVAAEELGRSYRLASLSADLPSCQTVSGFVALALQGFGYAAYISPTQPVGLDTLQQAISNFKASGELPLLCLDEFEGFGNHKEFDKDFFSGMRSLADTLGLCIVTVSKSPLIDIVGEIGQTSGFFNIFRQLRLQPFTSEETGEFLATKSKLAGFSLEDTERLNTYGQGLPVRLQLACKQLLEDKIMYARGKSYPYVLGDLKYWASFGERLDDEYRAIIKSL